MDAGLCWIGDPCYVLHREAGKEPPEIGKSWDEFCERLDQEQNATQFGEGGFGLGLAVSTGYGDGEYSVYARESDGRTAEVRIVFIDPRERDGYDPSDDDEYDDDDDDL